ncbi:LapA family protein [Streptomyces fenghuangensis]|uniref:LapA family protein n=1 Tax=Streptomyces chitinivorans TaxID=1257027 RepID=A0ABW7HR09_9ACTN|nr:MULTISPECIES: LapA family protein [Streptomyces]MCG3042295.1 hypothetical protein [Streptomyces sp. ICN903]MDH2409828.1 LapA family protein [Streptomyces chitinivorans]
MSTHRRTGDGSAPSGRHGFLTPGRVLVLLLLAATLVFVFQNTERTEIRLLVPVVTMPLWVALLIPGVIGLLSGMYLVRRR